MKNQKKKKKLKKNLKKKNLNLLTIGLNSIKFVESHPFLSVMYEEELKFIHDMGRR